MEENKERGIGKVLSLLNEFETPKSGIVFKSYDDYDGTFYGVDCDGEMEIAWSDSMILSKRFQFVERLVDNDKIEWTKIKRNLERVHWYSDGTLNYTDGFTDTEILLMELSIQDEPIDFLCSILK